MLHIYLDTALLSVPSYATDHDTAQELIDRITHFSLVTSSGLPIRVVVGNSAEQILDVGYPTLEAIRDYLEIMGLSFDYAPNDLLRQYQTILSRASRPSDLKVTEVDAVDDFTVEPNIPAGLSPCDLEAETRRVFATVALNSGRKPGWRIGSSIQGITEQQFHVEAVATAISAHGEETTDQAPLEISSSVRTTSNLAATMAGTSEDLWIAATDSNDRHLAIIAGALRIKRQHNPEARLDDLLHIRVGSDFEASLRAHQCDGTNRYSLATFELCCQIAADLCNRAINPMGRPSQTVRGGDRATAWRVHLTKAGLGLRLMIWRDGDVIEFANVGVKHALEIEEGDPSLRSHIEVENFFD